MSEQIFKDYIPANARIVIDYLADEPVKFSYPKDYTYWQAVRKCAFETCATAWIGLHLGIVRFILPGLFVFAIYDVIANPTVETITSVVETSFSSTLVPLFFAFLGVIFYLAGLPFIFVHILALNKNLMGKWMPQIGYYGIKFANGKTYQQTFRTEHINEQNVCVISCFSNIFLDYKTEGDFAKYLERMEILELPHTVLKKSWGVYKKEKEEYLFRATFHFVKKPITGQLEVEYI